jgi:hypothetical protein
MDASQPKHSPYVFKQLISLILGLVLSFSLLSNNNHKQAKFNISEILTIIWLGYSIYYRDYPVMIICGLILLYSFSQNTRVL